MFTVRFACRNVKRNASSFWALKPTVEFYATAARQISTGKPPLAAGTGAENLQQTTYPSSRPARPKSASETYTKLSQIEHILKRPDSYIGSVEKIIQPTWTFDSASKKMVYRDVSYVPGFFKIVDEILVNAADHKTNDATMDTLKVTIDVDENTISVYNNGRGIPVEMHSKENVWIPELLFGHLLSGSNYDDQEKKLTGGRNGFGAKLANIYSHEFMVETSDSHSKQKYKQTWTENMSTRGKPKVTAHSKGEDFTRITFRPDLARFGMQRIDEDTYGLLQKRVYDMAGVLKDVKVFLNNERLKIKGFKSYVDMFTTSSTTDSNKPAVIYEQIGDRWEVVFTVSPDGTFQHLSFANAIATTKGGTHVDLIASQIAKGVVAHIAKKDKVQVKLPQVKAHMWIFVNALIENPTFDSQTKEQLTLPASKFGTKPVVSDDFMKKVYKSPIVEHILNWAKFKADQEFKKSDGAKRGRLTGLPKLSDANNAGTKHAKDCTLILTEGDSAKALAVAGLSVVGRDNFGVFPLRGKLLNVREAKLDQIVKNEEIQNIKKIMGLTTGKDYSDPASLESLRYGRLMIMADQDHDGSHIKGLLINFFDHFFPSLLTHPNFLVEFVTPIVRVTKGKEKKNFFTIPEYEQWLRDTQDSHLWTVKYYKGLGTSTDRDAMDYFSAIDKHRIPFAPMQEGDKGLIDLAFSKKRADERKEWLSELMPGTYLDHRLKEIPYSEFINKELILFSMADNIRSIPSVADGLKPSQRKVIWASFKRNLNKEVKVAQLVGYISEQAAYHHGEQSLMMTIINLAQDFVGSNNLNLLSPNGQYGTREMGGADHASARYIFTQLMPIARTVFHPADDALLKEQKEDNESIEPEWYLPILPMILVNGAEGIGTGWSTSIPSYNPLDIVANLRRLMKNEELIPMHPWWRGFKGEISMVAPNKYDISGVVKKVDNTTVEITELPIHMWTKNFKEHLEDLVTSGAIKDYQEHHANQDVHFVIQMPPAKLMKAETQGLVEYFKLKSKLSTTNMICFDFDGRIKKYDTPEDILREFFRVRLALYQKRKDHLQRELRAVLDRLVNQARFIRMIVDGKLLIANRARSDIAVDMDKHGFSPIHGASEANEDGYHYLLSMPMWNLTREKIDRLTRQADDKKKELEALLEVSPEEMWDGDLAKFVHEWDKALKEHGDKKMPGRSKRRRQS